MGQWDIHATRIGRNGADQIWITLYGTGPDDSTPLASFASSSSGTIEGDFKSDDLGPMLLTADVDTVTIDPPPPPPAVSLLPWLVAPALAIAGAGMSRAPRTA